MDYLNEIRNNANTPGQIEELYHNAQKAGQAEAFENAMLSCFEESPENLLYAAWYFRLKKISSPVVEKPKGVSVWLLALPLAVLNGLVFWAISDPKFMFLSFVPYVALFGAPIAALFMIGFLVLTARRGYKQALIAGGGLAAACLYVLLIVPTQVSYYQSPTTTMMLIHLALLAWVAVGISVLSFRSTFQERFPFLIKSIEVFITGGLYLTAGSAFGMITVGMFQALSIQLPEVIIRLGAAGGAGLLPVIGLASIYDPRLKPSEQDFRQGLSKFIANMMRLLLPLTLIILVIYIVVIPFNFMEPFKNRDVLIVYNAMLFGIIGLLLGVTPVRTDDISPRIQKALRTGILVVSILAILVSLYALSAIIYRTVLGGITINRLAVIGWNTLNTGILVLLVARLLRKKDTPWTQELQSIFSLGAAGYTIWGLFIVLAIPLLFR
jgi:hypothetical protein